MGRPKGSKYIKYGSYSVAGIVTAVAVFFILAQQGYLDISNYDYSHNCAGTKSDICWLEIDFSPNADIFIGKGDEWLNTTPPVKDLKMFRSWSNGWREIPLEEGCSGSWCGCYWCSATNRAEYAIVFRNNSDYEIRFEATKYNPDDVIDWSINPEGVWDKAIPKKECAEYKDIIKYKIVKVNKTEEVCTAKVKEIKLKVPVNGSYDGTEITYDCKNVTKKVKTKVPYIEQKCVKEKFVYGEQEIINGTCTIKENEIICDDGVGGDGNGDGICQSGETCTTWKFDKSLYIEKIMNGDVKIK